MMKYYISVILLLISVVAFSAKPKIVKRTRAINNGMYTEKYAVLANDTSCKHGPYSLIYKGKTIEKGQYKKGQRVGVWEFYNFHYVIEFKYDYDKQIPFNIMKHKGLVYSPRTFPSMYLGSPIVPHHLIAINAHYPVKESENDKECKVVLALHINSHGKMTGYSLKQPSKEAFNESVLRAASKIPKNWVWVPARQDGRNVDSEYLISVVFDAVE